MDETNLHSQGKNTDQTQRGVIFVNTGQEINQENNLMWQGTEDPGGLRTSDFRVASHEREPFGKREIPLAKWRTTNCSMVAGLPTATLTKPKKTSKAFFFFF